MADIGTMKVVKGSEGEWMYDAGPHLVAYACHHRKTGACGGRYARAMRVLDLLKSEPVVAQLIEAVRAEGAAKKAPKR